MSNDTDFYKILEIEKGASDDEIKKAFRRFSKKYHPDMQHGKSDAEKKEAEETFKKGQAAYECLSDPEKRKIYDEYGIEGLQGHAQQGGFSGGMPDGLAEFLRRHMGGFGFGFNPFGGMDDDDDEGFNPFGHRQSKRKAPSNLDPEDGQSYRIRMEIDLEDVIFGAEKEFTMDGFDVCPECHGKKCDGYDECPDCHGQGMTQRISGNMIFRSTCGRCGGTGYFPKNVCKKCGGSGRVQVKRQIKVKIPIGFPSGGTLRIKDAGAAGLNGGKNGDLYIVVTTKKHPIFRRNPEYGDLDLQIDLFVNPLTFVYGGNVSIPTPYEMLSERLFSGMRNGQTFKLNGYGMRRSENERGDLIVKLVFDTIDSTPLDKEADEALRKAIMLLENNENKDYLIGSRKQIKDLNTKTKLPWIVSIEK